MLALMGKSVGHSRTRSALFAAFCAVSFIASSAAKAEEDLAVRIERWLASGVEPGSAHAQITALGDDAELALIDLFQRKDATRLVRLRALTELASFDDPIAAAYLHELVRAAREPTAWLGELHPARSSLVLRRALSGLTLSGHWLHPNLDMMAVSACLDHSDPHVRRAAANSLSRAGASAIADRALIARRATDRSRMVRASAEDALQTRTTSAR